MSVELLRTPPRFCTYTGGNCDQSFDHTDATAGVVLYASDPPQIAATIESAVDLLAAAQGERWLTWRGFRTAGQVVFCSICRSVRFCGIVVADVTTLNFNLMFEIGFALGLELPLALIRDTSYVKHTREFEELGMLDTIGYIDFQNSQGLADAIRKALPLTSIPTPVTKPSPDPLYVVKDPIGHEGQVRLLSVLRKSPLRFRSYDPIEDPRLTLHEARKQVAASVGVVGHVLAPERRDSAVHNARTALIAGLAAASGKSVVLLHEGGAVQPVDYRDIVTGYVTPDQIAPRLERFIRTVTISLQDTAGVAPPPPAGLLERLDLGDVAAENEIRQLRTYFVPTGQFSDAKRGYARLVVGRKGAGKTAIFYAVRDALPRTPSYLVLDMKPEGHQFTKLREAILSRLSAGLQEHTLTAFWNHILLCEIAQKVLDTDYSWAERDTERFRKFEVLREIHAQQMPDDTGDLSERLMHQIDVLAARFETAGQPTSARELTQALFRSDIPLIERAVADYLSEKKEVWLLVDNLDKGWTTRGATSADILLIRTLLEATRKLQRQLAEREVEFHALVFLRNDIYEHLVIETPDREKDTAIVLDWDDIALFREIVRQRLIRTDEISGSFEEVWPRVFAAQVGSRESFGYAVERTLMRPRDLLKFLHRSIEFAVNRGHNTVTEDDFVSAEAKHSEDMLIAVNFEIGDVAASFRDILYHFISAPISMTEQDAKIRLSSGGIEAAKLDEAITLLVWFGFLGVQSPKTEVQFAYQVHYNLTKLLALLRSEGGTLVVHPAFRTALGCTVALDTLRLPYPDGTTLQQ